MEMSITVNGKRVRSMGKYADGSIYDSEFKDGKMHEKGICNDADGSVYNGEFNGDYRHGKGIHTYTDGNAHDGE